MRWEKKYNVNYYCSLGWLITELESILKNKLWDTEENYFTHLVYVNTETN